MTDLNDLPQLTAIAPVDQFLVRDKSDTTDGANGSDKYVDFSDLNPLIMGSATVKLVYMTTAVSGVGADGWYFTHDTSAVATTTGRNASITWEGTSAQIPAQGTGDAQFQIGDTALVRASSL